MDLIAMTIFNSPTDVVVECPADGRMDGLVAQTHHCNNTGVMDLTAARNVQVDPSAPGGYSKKSLPLEEKQRLFPDFIAASPRGLVPAITHIRQPVWESLHVVEYIDTVFSSAHSTTYCCR